MGLQTNTQPHSWITGASSSFVNLTATNFNIGTGYLTNCLNITPNACIFGDRTTCVIGGNIAHTLIDSTSSIKTVRGSNTASGYYSLVAGGSGNTVSGNCAAIVGGSLNVAKGDRSFIGGGCLNQALSAGSVILAGRYNTSSGSSAHIGTGTCNSATATDTVILGGVCNIACGIRAGIVNGCANTASGTYSTVVNGLSNIANIAHAFIGSGKTNSASGIYTVVVGGSGNNASGSYNVIGGGISNNTSSGYTTIGGGKGNKITGSFSVVVGGSANNVSGINSGILGGSNNVLTHNNSFIAGSNITSQADNTFHANNMNFTGNLTAYDITSTGHLYGNGYFLNNLNPANLPANYTHCWSIGTNAIQPVTPALVTQNNAASGICSGIFAGGYNTIGTVGAFSYIGAGRCNIVNSPYSTVVGGSANYISTASAYAFIGGGSVNSLSSANTTIVGGWCNAVNTNSGYGTIVGGAKNTASGTYTAVVGGSYNNACQSWAAVVGGSNNTASGYSAGVNAGDFNVACGVNSNINGGHRNSVNGGVSNINGGYCNTVNGWFSNVDGGACNTVNNNFASIVGGNANIANAANTFTLGSNLSANVANYTYVNNLAVGTNSPNKTVTVVGDISATGNFYASSIDKLTIPTSQTFTGNGVLSTFNLGNTVPNINSASYIVTLNGATQVPGVDYSIYYSSNFNYLSTSFIPPNGSTLSVISLNTSVYGLADGTVTLSKLATNAINTIASAVVQSISSQNVVANTLSATVVYDLYGNSNNWNSVYTGYRAATGGTLNLNNLTVSGTFITLGSSVTLSSTNLVVSDPIIYFGTGNAANLYDLGIISHFTGNLNNGANAYQHSGLIRQSGQNSPGAWTLFSGLTSEPLSSTNINWNDLYFQYDNLNVGFINSDTSKFTSTGNTQIVSLKNNSTASGYIYGQNTNSGVSASTDIALYNNNNTAYIDMGINSSNFNGNSYQYPFTIAAANDSYIYSSLGSNNLTIGTQNSSGDLLLFTGGVLSGVSGNERVRVKSTGNVGIGVSTPNKLLTVAGDISATGNIFGNSYVNVLPASATSYQIAPTDNGTTIASLNNTTGLTATITGTYPAGFQVGLLQLSTGRLNVNGGTNINQANGYFKTNKQYSAATLIYTGATAGWVLFGDLNS